MSQSAPAAPKPPPKDTTRAAPSSSPAKTAAPQRNAPAWYITLSKLQITRSMHELGIRFDCTVRRSTHADQHAEFLPARVPQRGTHVPRACDVCLGAVHDRAEPDCPRAAPANPCHDPHARRWVRRGCARAARTAQHARALVCMGSERADTACAQGDASVYRVRIQLRTAPCRGRSTRRAAQAGGQGRGAGAVACPCFFRRAV